MAKAFDIYTPDKKVKHVAIYCPACKTHHCFDSRWHFNGNYEKPTFTPSMLVNRDKRFQSSGNPRCHSFVTDGKIQFLSDCTHDMSQQTVELPDIE